MQEIEANIFWVGNKGLEAAENQLIVLLDPYRSGFECVRCGDREHRIKKGGEDGQTESVIDCENCAGTGFYQKGENQIGCGICGRTGKIPCPSCQGKGSQTIVIPDSQKGRPTSGVIVSCGENVRRYKLAERVLCPAYAGHGLTLTGYDLATDKTVEASIQILLENDILAKIHGGSPEYKMFKASAALHTNA